MTHAEGREMRKQMCPCGKDLVAIAKAGLCRACYAREQYTPKIGRRADTEARRTERAKERESRKVARRAEIESRSLQFIEAYQSLWNLEAVGQQFGVSRERVRQILKSSGVAPRQIKPKAPVFVPLTEDQLIERLYARLASLIEIRADDECWFWLGSTFAANKLCPDYRYGGLHVSRPLFPESKKKSAHVVMYLLFNGPIAKGMTVDHICYNPICCNPAHLDLKTRAENTANHSPAWYAKMAARRGMPRSHKSVAA